MKIPTVYHFSDSSLILGFASSFSSFALALGPRTAFIVVMSLLPTAADVVVVPGIVVTTVGTAEFNVPLLLLLRIFAGGLTGDCSRGDVSMNCFEFASKYFIVVVVGCWGCGLAAMVRAPDGDEETVDDDVVLIRSDSTEVAEAAASASASKCPPVVVLLMFADDNPESSVLTNGLLGICATSWVPSAKVPTWVNSLPLPVVLNVMVCVSPESDLVKLSIVPLD